MNRRRLSAAAFFGTSLLNLQPALLALDPTAAVGGSDEPDTAELGGAPSARTLDLARTGQTRCFDDQGVPIACLGTGQDGEIQAGIPWPEPRFIDHLNGTITDTLTGLMWLEDANCVATRYPAFDNEGTPGDGAVLWQSALDFVIGINDGSYPDCAVGHDDWHLANVNELFSLIHLGDPDPELWLASQGFENVMSGGFRGYWSATSNIGEPWKAYVLIMDFPEVFPTPKAGSPPAYHFLWPVRETQPGPAPIWQTGQVTCYSAAGDAIPCAGTGQDGEVQAGVAWPPGRLGVTYCDAAGPCPNQTSDCDGDASTDLVQDLLTGLEWARDANVRSVFDQWQGTLDWVAGVNAGSGLCGLRDWRVPNTKELHSLADFGQADPSLPGGHPFVNLPPGGLPSYWTSTFSEPRLPSAQAWWVRYKPELVMLTAGTGSVAYAWPVRAGFLLIFADGFESGDTSAWSSAVP